jgi:nitroreductase
MNNEKLPAPAAVAGMDVIAALRLRRSTREYDLTREITLDALSTLLWAADGLSGPEDKRTAPSAFGRNQVKIYVATHGSVSRYDAPEHSLARTSSEDVRAMLSDDEWVATAPVVFILTARLDDYPEFIPASMRAELSHATAGCIAENLHLAAAALGMGTCMVGSIHADAIRSGLSLSAGETPLYAMPIGYLRA